MFFSSTKKLAMPSPDQALPGHDQPIRVGETHFINGHRIIAPFPEGMKLAVFGMGCFWGAERKFWETPGVYSTAVGYAGGYTQNPTYEEVCSGRTGHTEVVLVVYDPREVSYDKLLAVFWENHDPTQGMRQGNDLGTPVPLGDLHVRCRPGRLRRGVTHRVPGAAREGRPRRDHDRDPRGAGVLLRRGLPPAVPGQEPGRLLRPRRDRGVVSDRARAGRRPAAAS